MAEPWETLWVQVARDRLFWLSRLHTELGTVWVQVARDRPTLLQNYMSAIVAVGQAEAVEPVLKV